MLDGETRGYWIFCGLFILLCGNTCSEGKLGTWNRATRYEKLHTTILKIKVDGELKSHFSLFFTFFQADDEYMISDFDLCVTKYVSVPKEMGHLNCNAFVAGIVGGVLDGAGFPAR